MTIHNKLNGNTPVHTLSRMIHNGYNFDNLPESELKLLLSKINYHKSTCRQCLANEPKINPIETIVGFLDDQI